MAMLQTQPILSRVVSAFWNDKQTGRRKRRVVLIVFIHERLQVGNIKGAMLFVRDS